MAHEEEFQQLRENHNESNRIDYMSNYKKKVKTVMVNNFANINKVSLVCACLMTHFNNISAISRRTRSFICGGNRNTPRKQLFCHKSL
jgi:hypothetical protein